jgi:nucleoid-associated protein YgaU
MWGTLQIKRCVLKSASIAYKLFKPDGIPLRAVITANFTDNSDDQTSQAIAQNQSSDLTHVRLVKAGETLPSLCEQIYGDPHYYLEVARANKIDNFRNLAPGIKLLFPPLEK